jgi:hypothetical protein
LLQRNIGCLRVVGTRQHSIKRVRPWAYRALQFLLTAFEGRKERGGVPPFGWKVIVCQEQTRLRPRVYVCSAERHRHAEIESHALERLAVIMERADRI